MMGRGSAKTEMSEARPSTAKELWTRLVALFPNFADWHTLNDLDQDERDGAPMLHAVMHSFSTWFGGDPTSMTPEQLNGLAMLLNQAVSVDDDLENAVSTCFLEHLRQIKGYKMLAPYLSATAKRKTCA